MWFLALADQIWVKKTLRVLVVYVSVLKKLENIKKDNAYKIGL